MRRVQKVASGVQCESRRVGKKFEKARERLRKREREIRKWFRVSQIQQQQQQSSKATLKLVSRAMRPCLLDRAKGSCGGRGSLGRNAAASNWSSELLAFFQSLGETTTTTTTTSSSQDKVRARSDAVLQRWRFGSDACTAAIFFFFTSGRRFFRRTLFQGRETVAGQKSNHRKRPSLLPSRSRTDWLCSITRLEVSASSNAHNLAGLTASKIPERRSRSSWGQKRKSERERLNKHAKGSVGNSRLVFVVVGVEVRVVLLPVSGGFAREDW